MGTYPVIKEVKTVKTYAEPYQAVINEIPCESDTTAVAERIRVTYPELLKQSDEHIARGASNALTWNVSVPPDCVKVRVQDGVVTLSGEMGWEYQKFAAEESVRYFTGEALVNNQIKIKPKVNSRW